MRWKRKKDFCLISVMALLLLNILFNLSSSQSTSNRVNIQTGVYLQPTTWIKPALSFDGVNDYAEIASTADLQILNDFSIAGWIYPTNDVLDFQGLCCKGVSNHQGWNIVYYGTTETLSLWLSNGTAYNYLASNDKAPLNTWTYFTIVKSGSNASYYFNGLYDKSYTVIDHVSSPRSLTVGWTGSGWDVHYKGSIDELTIYTRAISQAEILYGYNIGKGYHTPYSTSGLELWLKMNENSGIHAEDNSGNSNDAILQGCSWDSGKVVTGIVQNRYAFPSSLQVVNASLDAGTLRLSKGSNAYDIECLTGDDVTVSILRWFDGTHYTTRFNPLAEIEESLSFQVNTRERGEPHKISGVSSWSFNDASSTLSLTCQNVSTVEFFYLSDAELQFEWITLRTLTWVGIAGIATMVVTPFLVVLFIKSKEFETASIVALLGFAIGFSMMVAWLWS